MLKLLICFVVGFVLGEAFAPQVPYRNTNEPPKTAPKYRPHMDRRG